MSYVIAHRGASFHAPENTLSAFQKAIELGVDGVETDVQITADKKLVIHHNYCIDLTTPAHGRVIDLTLEQLKEVDFGIMKGPEFAGEHILTLDECLEATKPLKLVNIELKAPADPTLPYVEMVVESICKHLMTEKVILSSFNHDLLRQTKAICPELRVGLLTSPPANENDLLFRTMKNLIPNDRVMAEVRLEDLNVTDEALSACAKFYGDGTNPEASMIEAVYTVMALCPHRTIIEAIQDLKKQNDLVEYVKSLDFKPDCIHPHFVSLLQDGQLVEKMAELGVGVSPWTVNDPEKQAEFCKLGCFGIITDRPDYLLDK